MKTSRLLESVGAAIVVAGLAAAPSQAGSDKKLYAPKVQKAKLAATTLKAFEGMEANIIRLELPPGYVGGKHYHTGDVFVYVESGSFAVEAGGKQMVFKAGEVYQETPGAVMLARNPSSAEGATIVVFQVGKEKEPIMFKAK
jgi:quercetin dioxygenase-like cupin family protein